MRGGRGAESEAKPAERHCLLLSVPVHAWCVIPGVNNLQARVPAIVHPGYTSFIWPQPPDTAGAKVRVQAKHASTPCELS